MPLCKKGFCTPDKIIKKNVCCFHCFYFCKYYSRRKQENSEMSHYICVASGYLALTWHALTDLKDVQLFICNSKCLHNSITL